MARSSRGLYVFGDDDETMHHTCARIIHGNGDAQGNPATRNEPALVVDGSGFAARLIVLPSFGCVLHEVK